MMQNELEQRIGKKLEPWQWEMAHFVYQNSPEIHDVGGKDEMAIMILHCGGFEYGSEIRNNYKKLKGPTIIVEHKQDLYTTYDVTHESLCINIKPRLAYDIFKDVTKTWEEKYPKLVEDTDYFSYSGNDEYQKEHITPWPDNCSVCIHYVKGGSEGYYVHIAIVDDGKYNVMFLGKTLREGEAGITWAEKMVAALSRIMSV
jgi:hypothetical protein